MQATNEEVILKVHAAKSWRTSELSSLETNLQGMLYVE